MFQKMCADQGRVLSILPLNEDQERGEMVRSLPNFKGRKRLKDVSGGWSAGGGEMIEVADYGEDWVFCG